MLVNINLSQKAFDLMNASNSWFDFPTARQGKESLDRNHIFIRIMYAAI